MERLLEQVPNECHRTFIAIVELVDAFCEKYLNEDYQQLCRDMAIRVCQKGSPVNRGKPAGWSSGIVHALGWVNFLQDPDTEPYMTSAEMAKGFGVSQGTMTAKSKIIRDRLSIVTFDPNWCLPDMLEHNPLVWMIKVNGFVIDVRMASRDIQEAAYRKGLIPYIPEPEEKHDMQTENEPKIIKFPTEERKTSKPKRHEKVKDDGPSLFD